MNKSILTIYLTILITLISLRTYSQNLKNAMDSISTKSKLWDIAFNERDTTTYFKFVTKNIAETVGGGTSLGSEKFKKGTKYLFKERPDITFYLNPKMIEINDQWKIAYDTGEWLERWTEKNDKQHSEIFGKYWRMWKFINNEWMIMSIIYTPLSCKGSYCDK
jgi:hypothetical protein